MSVCSADNNTEMCAKKALQRELKVLRQEPGSAMIGKNLIWMPCA